MSEEDNLIEELKKSLIITENEYLKSEIEDLKEFFTVQTQTTDETDSFIDKKCFWLEVFLPVTLRKITKDGKEVLKNKKPLMSFKIKLKNGIILPVAGKEIENESKLEIQATDKEEDILLETEVITSTISNDNFIITANTDNTDNSTDCIIESTESTEVIVNSTNSPSIEVVDNSFTLLYEIIDVKISELNEETEQTDTNLLEIFKSLIYPNNLSLLNVIEQFYIKLEEKNYPNKNVICRDYYYPVFDCRHWGRSLSSNNKSQSSTDNSSLSISYRARALYDFQALMQGELSFQENEILIVLANLGNGWLTARRTSTSSTSSNETSDDTITGLIPENYIERL